MCLIACSLPSPKGFPGTTLVKNPPANTEDTRDAASIPGLGRSPGEGNGYPLQHSCLGNPMTEEPGGLQSTVLQTVRHDLATKQQQPGGKTMVSPRGTKGWSAHFYCSWLWCSMARVTRMQRLSRRRKTIIACNLTFSWQEVT